MIILNKEDKIIIINEKSKKVNQKNYVFLSKPKTISLCFQFVKEQIQMENITSCNRAIKIDHTDLNKPNKAQYLL